MKRKQYGLPTAITMIVGIVIGSGIFFKSDNILVATRGSVSLGILVFVLAAVSIIFGSLSIAELAARTDKPGGVITYAEESTGKTSACIIGWFHTFLYYPTLIAVVAWVTGVYSCILFGLEGTLTQQILIGLLVFAALYGLNLLSSKLGGYFQNASTFIKLIPLLVIAVAGFAFGDVSEIRYSDVTQMVNTGWITAIGPIAFAFDGWIVSTSIAHEVKNAKRNIPLSLIIAPLFILLVYIAYFVGISIYIGPMKIMHMGDAHVYAAAKHLLGPIGAKAILIFIIISVMGTVNGLTMGLLRQPYALAMRGMLPFSHRFIGKNARSGMSRAAAWMAFALVLFWTAVHWITQRFEILPNADVSEISITVNYCLYVVLYLAVIRYAAKGEIKGLWRGKINPILATLGSAMILYGGMQNTYFWVYALVCLAFIAAAAVYWRRVGCKRGWQEQQDG